MTKEYIIFLFRNAIKTGFLLSAPFLFSTMLVGFFVSVFQASTQINEQTLSFIPKLFSVFLVCILVGPWMLGVIIDYMKNVFDNLSIIIQ